MKMPRLLTPAEAIRKARGQAALARLFSPPVHRQSVSAWLKAGRIPLRRIWELAQIRPEWFK